MKMLGADKTGFRMWHEKLVNIMEQLRPGSRGVLKALARHVDNEEDADIHEWIIDEPEYLQMGDAAKAEAQMKSVNEDLYVIMLDKSESEALTRVRACPVGEGLQAYRAVYKWFMGVSGQAISDKIRKLMAPTTPKMEQEVADHLDKWIESIRTLENMRSEYKLQDPFKIIALEQIMAVGQARPSSTSNRPRPRAAAFGRGLWSRPSAAAIQASILADCCSQGGPKTVPRFRARFLGCFPSRVLFFPGASNLFLADGVRRLKR